MNQTRSFLLIAWLFVAALLWMEWNKQPDAAPPSAVPTTNGPAAPAGTSTAAAMTAAALPATPAAAATTGPTAMSTMAADDTTSASAPIVLENDVLRLTIDPVGGRLLDSQLLAYTLEKKPGSPNVHLLSADPAHYFTAASGFVRSGAGGAVQDVPELFRTEDGASAYRLKSGQSQVSVTLVATDPVGGLTMRRTLTLARGSYALDVREQVTNHGATATQLFPFMDLARVTPPAPPKHSGLTNPEAFSFVGAAWYGPESKYERATLADFAKQVPLNKDVASGWIAMIQHHFLAAWVPRGDEAQKFSLSIAEHLGAPLYRVRSIAAPIALAPGASGQHETRLWVGPKLQHELAAMAPGLDRAVDYSRFALLALLADGLFWVLSHLHALIGNWGWSIIAIVVLLKLVLYPLSAAQYKSMAKMRAVQPRIEALKERYGDDRQQFQIAMMELYKKEKINPIGGCLPMLIPIPIFIALYDLLLESVELRHAPWMGWIQNLTAADPYFILPALNLAVMFLTQKLTPTPGMDPMQKKMMQFMPLVFGGMMAFFPSGLVLYWVTNGLLGLLQQWWMTRQHGTPGKAVSAK